MKETFIEWILEFYYSFVLAVTFISEMIGEGICFVSEKIFYMVGYSLAIILSLILIIFYPAVSYSGWRNFITMKNRQAESLKKNFFFGTVFFTGIILYSIHYFIIGERTALCLACLCIVMYTVFFVDLCLIINHKERTA